MHFAKLFFLAACIACVAITVRGDAISATQAVANAEAAVKSATLGLTTAKSTFQKLAVASATLQQTLPSSASALGSVRVDAATSSKLVSLVSGISGNVGAACGHISSIAAKLKSGGVDDEIKQGLVKLQGEFGAFGRALERIIDASQNSKVTSLFSSINSNLGAAVKSVS